MIKKMSEEWGRVEESLPPERPMDPAELQHVIRAIEGVRDALRTMSQVSVTRTTLKSAVREALFPLLKEHAGELFPNPNPNPNIVSTSAAVFPEAVSAQLESFEERIHRLLEAKDEIQSSLELYGQRVDGLDSRLESVDGHVRGIDARLGGVSARLDELQASLSRVGEMGSRLSALEEWIGEVNFRVAGVDSRLGVADEGVWTLKQGLEQSFQVLRDEMRDAEERHGESLAALRSTVESRVQVELAGVTERIASVREHLAKLLAGVEASIPGAMDAKTAALEASLRREIEQMIGSVMERISELREVLANVQTMMPRREQLDSVNDLLIRLEERVSRVAGQVEGLDSLTPDFKTFGGKLSALQADLGAISYDLRQTGKGIGDRLGEGFGDLKDGFVRQLAELHSLLEAGIHRWESDQSQMLERLGAIRDSLRDQFRAVLESAASAETSFLGKFTGRKQGGLKLSRDDWERLSAKIEGIISGLESILAKKQEKQEEKEKQG